MSDQDNATVGALSIDEFCERHRFSRPTFYNMEKEGIAPKTFRIGARRFISNQAAAAWLAEREKAEAEESAAFKAKRVKIGSGRPRKKQA